jgi:hypothetical protein
VFSQLFVLLFSARKMSQSGNEKDLKKLAANNEIIARLKKENTRILKRINGDKKNRKIRQFL